MSLLQIVLLLTVFCAMPLLWWLRRRASRARGEGADADRIDTLIGWPPQATTKVALAQVVSGAKVKYSFQISTPKTASNRTICSKDIGMRLWRQGEPSAMRVARHP